MDSDRNPATGNRDEPSTASTSSRTRSTGTTKPASGRAPAARSFRRRHSAREPKADVEYVLADLLDPPVRSRQPDGHRSLRGGLLPGLQGRPMVGLGTQLLQDLVSVRRRRNRPNAAMRGRAGQRRRRQGRLPGRSRLRELLRHDRVARSGAPAVLRRARQRRGRQGRPPGRPRLHRLLRHDRVARPGATQAAVLGLSGQRRDGHIDHPADPGCDSTGYTAESPDTSDSCQREIVVPVTSYRFYRAS